MKNASVEGKASVGNTQSGIVYADGAGARSSSICKLSCVCCLAWFVIMGCCAAPTAKASYGKEKYKKLETALLENCKKMQLPYDKSLIPAKYCFDKFRQTEFYEAERGNVSPLGVLGDEGNGMVERCIANVPLGHVILLLQVSLGKKSKVLQYPGHEPPFLFSVNSNEYAVLNVKIENADTKQDVISKAKVSVRKLPPSIDLPKREIAEGEMVLVFTPQGVFARPWYNKRFNYYWFSE